MTPPLVAISVLQPWAWLICHRGKDIENSSRYWGYRGPVAIHASARRSGDEAWQAEFFCRRIRAGIEFPPLETTSRGSVTNWPWFWPTGAIVGTATVAGCVDDAAKLEMLGRSSRWFTGLYGLILEGVRPLVEPVPCKGALGIWRLPPDVAGEVGRQMEGCAQ